MIGVVAIVIAAIAMRLSDDGPLTTEEWADEVCTSLANRPPEASNVWSLTAATPLLERHLGQPE